MRHLAVVVATLLAFPAVAQVDLKLGDTNVKIDASGTKVDVSGLKVEDPKTANVRVSADEHAPAAAKGKKSKDKVRQIDGVGVVETLVCEKDGLQRIEVNGTTARLTVTGECNELVVSGAGNVVTMAYVGKIDVTGTSNSVHYKGASAANKKKKVAVSVTGLDNKADQVPTSGH